MNYSVTSPVYSQIALDIALRITRGELKENTKVYGRSVMASEYGVSPETIRRAMKLLEDMEIIEVQHNSGVVILSCEKSRLYVEKHSEQNDIRLRQKELSQLLLEQGELAKRIEDVANSIVRINERFSKTTPFLNYEAALPEGCPLIGKSLGEMKFWQQTGATVIAIRRNDQIILSPGPYAVLEEKDILMFVGDLNCPNSVNMFLKQGY